MTLHSDSRPNEAKTSTKRKEDWTQFENTTTIHRVIVSFSFVNFTWNIFVRRIQIVCWSSAINVKALAHMNLISRCFDVSFFFFFDRVFFLFFFFSQLNLSHVSIVMSALASSTPHFNLEFTVGWSKKILGKEQKSCTLRIDRDSEWWWREKKRLRIESLDQALATSNARNDFNEINYATCFSFQYPPQLLTSYSSSFGIVIKILMLWLWNYEEKEIV